VQHRESGDAEDETENEHWSERRGRTETGEMAGDGRLAARSVGGGTNYAEPDLERQHRQQVEKDVAEAAGLVAGCRAANAFAWPSKTLRTLNNWRKSKFRCKFGGET
jgi:hypothetical protein